MELIKEVLDFVYGDGFATMKIRDPEGRVRDYSATWEPGKFEINNLPLALDKGEYEQKAGGFSVAVKGKYGRLSYVYFSLTATFETYKEWGDRLLEVERMKSVMFAQRKAEEKEEARKERNKKSKEIPAGGWQYFEAPITEKELSRLLNL